MIGVPDAMRGQVVKAFVVTDRAGERRLRRRNAGLHARAPEPARISAARRIRERAAQDAGRARFTARCCASAKPLLRLRAPTEIPGEDDMSDQHQQVSRRSPRRAWTTCASASASRSTDTLEPWYYEATRDNIRHYAHGIGDDNPLWCDPEYAAKTQYGSIVALPSFLFTTSRIISGYCGGLSGRARHVGRRRLDLAQAGAAQRRDHHRGLPQGPGRAPDHASPAALPADLPRRLLQPARRQGRRAPTAGVPHRPRRSARARHEVHRSARPRRAATPRSSSPSSTSSTQTRKSAARPRATGKT